MTKTVALAGLALALLAATGPAAFAMQTPIQCRANCLSAYNAHRRLCPDERCVQIGKTALKHCEARCAR